MNVTVQGMNPDTGETTLTLTPRNAGPSPIVRYSTTAKVTADDPVVDDLDAFVTKEATVYFLAIDCEDKHQPWRPPSDGWLT